MFGLSVDQAVKDVVNRLLEPGKDMLSLDDIATFWDSVGTNTNAATQVKLHPVRLSVCVPRNSCWLTHGSGKLAAFSAGLDRTGGPAD